MKRHYCRSHLNLQPIAILLLCCSIIPWLNAEEINPLESLLPESCLLMGKFSQHKQLANIPKPLESAGQFVFDCKQGLLWLTETPHRETLVYRRDNEHYLLTSDHVDGEKRETEKVERLKGRIHRELGKILNNLIGADIDYLEKHFDHYLDQDLLSQDMSSQNTSSQDDQPRPQSTLVPKNKRLRNYIASIHLSKTLSGTLIDIQQGDEEAMQIRIFDTQALSYLDTENCTRYLPTQSLACQLLYQ